MSDREVQQLRGRLRFRPVLRVAGWSWIELLLVFMLLGLILQSALSNMHGWLVRQKLNRVASVLEADLMFARSLAMQRRQSIVVCPTEDKQSCLQSGGWSQGWIVFVDEDRDGVRHAGREIALRVQPWPPEVLIRVVASDPRYVLYRPDGRAYLVNGAFQAGHWSICMAGTRHEVRLVLNAAGRVRRQELGHGC